MKRKVFFLVAAIIFMMQFLVEPAFAVSPPQKLRASQNIPLHANEVTLSWSANIFEKRDIDNYKVYEVFNNKTTHIRTVEGTSCYLGKISSGSHRYYVTAVDEKGNETEQSNNCFVTILERVSISSNYVENGIVNLRWRCDLKNIKEFKIIRNGEVHATVKANSKNKNSAGEYFYEDKKAANGKPYVYSVVVIDKNNNYSPQSENVNLEVPAYKKEKGDLIVTPHVNGQIYVELKWNESYGSPYRIYRTGPDGSKKVLADTNETSYKDYDVIKNETYKYQVVVFENNNKIYETDVKKVKVTEPSITKKVKKTADVWGYKIPFLQLTGGITGFNNIAPLSSKINKIKVSLPGLTATIAKNYGGFRKMVGPSLTAPITRNFGGFGGMTGFFKNKELATKDKLNFCLSGNGHFNNALGSISNWGKSLFK